MFKTTILAMGLLTVFNTNAGCLQDTLEIGDIGPESDVVCDTLASIHPGKQIEIIGRDIRTQNEVTILLTIEGQKDSLSYRLVGADWIPYQRLIAENF